MKASFYDMPNPNHIQTALSGKTKFCVRNKTGHPEFLLERIVLRHVVEPDECERLKAERAGQENSERSVISEGIHMQQVPYRGSMPAPPPCSRRLLVTAIG